MATTATIVGPVRSVSTNVFTIYVESGCSGHGLLNIQYTAYTRFTGGKPAVGENATVTPENGTCTTKILAGQVTLTGGGTTTTAVSTRHLLTADYLGASYGSTIISYATAAKYLTWAQVSPSIANAVANSGIKTEYYVDPNQTINNGDALYTGSESTFAHTCAGGRVTGAYNGHTMYQMAIGTSAMQSLYGSVVRSIMASAHYDAVFEDGDGALGSAGLSSLPCSYSDAAWLTYQRALHQASPLPVVFNGLELLNGHNVSLTMQLLPTSNTLGGNYEFCYSATTEPEITGWIWTAAENTEIGVNAQDKMFFCMARNDLAAASQYRARLYTLASFLLTYNPAKSVLWEYFTTSSKFHVMPESQLVATNPVVATPSSITALRTAGGTYARQYSNCYYAGTSVGACAIVVNSDTVSHPFPYTAYHHTLVLSGSGIVEGGQAYTTGAAPASTIGPGTAQIVFQ